MAKRLMSAIFGITYVVLVLVFNGNLPVLLNISLAAVSAVCVFEVCSAMGIQKIYGMECYECGTCTYVCPAKRRMTQSFKQTRRSILDNRKKV